MQVLSIVDRIVVMDQGKIVMDGPRDAVLKKLTQNEQKARTATQRVIRPVAMVGSVATNSPKQTDTNAAQTAEAEHPIA